MSASRCRNLTKETKITKELPFLRRNSFLRISQGLPIVDDSALYSLAGDVVRAIEPHSESDPVAILFTFLTVFGAAVGRVPTTSLMVRSTLPACSLSW